MSTFASLNKTPPQLQTPQQRLQGHRGPGSSASEHSRIGLPSSFKVAPQSIVQPKITIGSTDDPLEREADLAAERVVAGRTLALSNVQRTMATGEFSLQRKCTGCGTQDEDDIRLHRKEEGPSTTNATLPPLFVAQLQHEREGGGQALDSTTRSFMESRFAADFSRVRLHNSSPSADLSRQRDR